MIVGHQPRSNNHIATAKPVVAYLYVREMFGPLNTLNISLVAIIQVMVSRNKINSRKTCCVVYGEWVVGVGSGVLERSLQVRPEHAPRT